MNRHSFLLDGGPGTGKTATAVSAFYDWKRKKQIRNGRLIVIGDEPLNESLGLPDELVRRFTSPSDKPLKFLDDLDSYLKKFIETNRTAKGDKHVEVMVFDGASELITAILHEHQQKNPASKDKWAKFDEAKERFIDIMQYLSPHESGAHLIMTARVDQRKRALETKDGKIITPGDPAWMEDFEYVPAAEGWTRKNIGHYFPFVFYMDYGKGVMKLPDGKLKDVVTHDIYLLPSPKLAAWVRNNYEYPWLQKGLPERLTNPDFDTILNLVEKAASGGAADGETEKGGSNE